MAEQVQQVKGMMEMLVGQMGGGQLDPVRTAMTASADPASAEVITTPNLEKLGNEDLVEVP